MIILFIIYLTSSFFTIDDFGAIPNNDCLSAQITNSRAIILAINAANQSLENDRIIIIPPNKYFSMPIKIQNLSNIIFRIQGKLIASKNVSNWPKQQKRYKNFLHITNSDRLIIQGGGKVDGRGYHWWILTLLGNKTKYLNHSNSRPHLILMENISNFIVRDLRLKNSANFHLKLHDVTNGTIYNLDIRVNLTAQINLLKYFSLQGIIPMYAFNTDGIDPTGSNLHIYNLTVQNYDDVVVPKPSNINNVYSNCTQNMLIQNITVKLGVGMSIGSISPSYAHNCIRNITFRNVNFNRPFKAIYIKTNPGNQGDGQVTNIVYQNMTIYKAIWWALYIGPQQMKQPDGAGPGCMLYPYDPHGTCQTQPLITISNISLIDIEIQDSWLYPITIRCNQTNPCKNFNFSNLKANRWYLGQHKTGMVCQHVKGVQKNTNPQIYCLNKQDIQGKQIKRQNQFDKDGWVILQKAVRDLASEVIQKDQWDVYQDPKQAINKLILSQ